MKYIKKTDYYSQNSLRITKVYFQSTIYFIITEADQFLHVIKKECIIFDSVCMSNIRLHGKNAYERDKGGRFAVGVLPFIKRFIRKT